jgi:16S rRNA (cytosine1402-N4)-methyltransferase
MALRIIVNRELERLEQFMDIVVDLLNPHGRLCVLSYHSLEDRIVKHRIKRMEKGCTCPSDFPKCVCGKKATVRNLTRKTIKPTKEEIQNNPMARSARLRAMEKC